jgi:thioredoxin 1
MKELDFQRKLRTSVKPIIVDLWAPWCKPCRAMEPSFEQVSEEYKNRVEVIKINADESAEVLQKLGVMSIPTVIAFAGGNELVRRSGMQSTQSLRVLFDSAVNKRKPDVMPLAPRDRILRVLIAIALFVAAWVANKNILLFVLAGVVLFTSFYDRCPVYKAVAAKFRTFFKKA